MTIDASAFKKHLHGTRSPCTAAAYGRIVDDLLKHRAAQGKEGPLAHTELEMYFARPRQDGAARSAATRNQELAAVRAFSAFAMRHHGWGEDPTNGIAFAKEPRRDPVVLTQGEVRALFEAIDGERNPVIRARELVVAALLSQLGLRVHELVGLDVEQVDFETRTRLRVDGKGATRSDLPLNAETAILLEHWLCFRGRLASVGETALLVSRRGTRLSTRTVERLVAHLGTRVTKKRLTPHTLRHTTATLALAFGCDVATVGDLLRHASLETTRGYLGLVSERKREAVQRLGTVIPRGVLVPEMSESLPAGSSPGTMERGEMPGRNLLDVQHDLNGIDEAA